MLITHTLSLCLKRQQHRCVLSDLPLPALLRPPLPPALLLLCRALPLPACAPVLLKVRLAWLRRSMMLKQTFVLPSEPSGCVEKSFGDLN